MSQYPSVRVVAAVTVAVVIAGAFLVWTWWRLRRRDEPRGFDVLPPKGRGE